MSEAKHTPGPWYVDQDERPGMQWNRHIHSQTADYAVCFMAHSDGKDPARDEANANLIAAAPNLLEALRDLLAVNTEAAGLSMSVIASSEEFAHFMRECERKCGAAETKARAAIAKAEGRS